MSKSIIIILLTAFFALSCNKKNEKTVTQENKQELKQETKQDTSKNKTMEIKIKSLAFEEGGNIPKKYACDGDNVSPPLSWTKGPSGTKSYAIITDDPDAPSKTWVHWVIYNIGPDMTELTEAVPNNNKLTNAALQGMNDSKKIGYSGPCPPSGSHRYYFKIYALDTMLEFTGDATKDKLLDGMKGHILAQGQLMGKYSKQ